MNKVNPTMSVLRAVTQVCVVVATVLFCAALPFLAYKLLMYALS